MGLKGGGDNNGMVEEEEEEGFGYDNTAVVSFPEQGGGVMVYTIDFFSSFVSDPVVAGKIVAVHALSDFYAMG